VIVEDNNSSSSQHGQDRVYAILARQDEELVQKAIGTPLTLADVEKTVHQQIDQNDGPLPFETAIDDKTAEGKAAATESLTFSAAAEEKPDDKKVLSHDEMAAAENAAYSGRPAALLAIASYTGSFRRFRVWANDGKV
jgi:hypothetical protein